MMQKNIWLLDISTVRFFFCIYNNFNNFNATKE
jgi:hypothetical protein